MKIRKILLFAVWGINAMCSLFIILSYTGIKFNPSASLTFFPWVAGFLLTNISLSFLAYLYARDLDRETTWWTLSTLLLPSITPVLLLFTLPRAKWTSNGYLWKCPKCGEILHKDDKELWDIFMSSGTVPIGTGACENCGVKLSQYDIYSGKYDI